MLTLENKFLIRRFLEKKKKKTLKRNFLTVKIVFQPKNIETEENV